MFASNLESDAKDCGYELIPYEEAIVQVARTLKLARPEDIEEPVSKAIISELVGPAGSPVASIQVFPLFVE